MIEPERPAVLHCHWARRSNWHRRIGAAILVQIDLDLEVRERGVLGVGIVRVCAPKYLRLHSQIAVTARRTSVEKDSVGVPKTGRSTRVNAFFMWDEDSSPPVRDRCLRNTGWPAQGALCRPGVPPRIATCVDKNASSKIASTARQSR